MPDLTGVRAKLEWAAEHRRAYDALFEAFLAAEPYTIEFDFEPETGWHTFRWKVTGEPPLVELALIFSDIVGNLRSTLDYLVWQLVLLGGERPGRKTMFPIVKREKDWAVQGATALRGVPEQWASLIEDMQPFQRFDAPELHPLAILEHVNNLTKHRFLPAAVLTADAFGYLINIADLPPDESFESRDSLERPVVDGGELARFRAESRRRVEVEIGSHPRFRLSFRDGVDLDWSPIDLVEWMREAVAQFEPAFL
jgi:hypothetical protein